MNKKEIKKLLEKADDNLQDAELELEDSEKIKNGSFIAYELNGVRSSLSDILEKYF